MKENKIPKGVRKMKKILLVALAVLMVLSTFVACQKPEEPEEPKEDIYTKSEGVMTYEQYAAAAVESKVVVETYIQAKQGWWEKDGVGVATFYTQDGVGGYFLYNMPCSEDDYNNKLKVGAKIKVTGYKAEWDGEVEIIDATWTLLEGNYVAPAKDVTATLANEAELVKLQNMFASVKGATVVASADKEGTEKPFLYKWDGSGQQGDDIYFKVSVDGKTYGFCVESYLCGKDSATYKAAEALKVGDKIDLEGFLYWYQGPQPHVTAIKAAK